MTKTKKETKEKVIKTPKEKEVVKVPKKKEYSVQIDINDSHFEAEADTIKEAFADIIKREDFPFAVKTRVFIKYSKGDVVKTKIVNTQMARKVFSIMAHKDSAIEIFADKLTSYLNE